MTTSNYRVLSSASIRDALETLDRSGLGIAVMTDAEDHVLRTVTDGDLRRLILKGAALEDPISALPDQPPIVATQGVSRAAALELMNTHKIDHVPVVTDQGQLTDLYDRKTISQRIFLSAPHMGDLEREFVEEAFASNWIAPIGPNVDAFENEMCATLGIKAAAALSSGSAALHLAMRLLDVVPGDRVFCSSLTFVASANPILYQGAEPVFIDSEPDSWNMSPVALERALSQAAAEKRLPKALVIVNLYGQSADMDPLLELADHYGVPVIEDAAESLGATYKGRASGTFGRMGVFSFNGNKIITTSGGGMLVSDDPDLIARARFLSTQAREPAVHYEHKEIGYNYRMSNILAGIGRGQLQVLGDRVNARRALYDAYREALTDVPGLSWMPEPAWSFANRWLSVFTLDPAAGHCDPRGLLTALGEEMIEARPVWKPLHRQPLFEGATYYTHGNTSVSDQFYDTGVCLPSGSNMSADDIARVTDKLLKVLS
ncbi:MAG: aminotransferase class I/II-fold pyridoxal phosphate-dependent enzyme [Sulfitobacter sp.]